MATWHQKRARPVELRHPTGWTIVTDPPNALCTLFVETSEQAAKERMVIWQQNGRDIRDCYILPPIGTKL